MLYEVITQRHWIVVLRGTGHRGQAPSAAQGDATDDVSRRLPRAERCPGKAG